MNLLLIDAGNSRIKWMRSGQGAFDATSVVSVTHDAIDGLAAAWSASHSMGIDAAWISNVAGAAVGTALERQVVAAFGSVPVHVVVPEAVACGVANGYRHPALLGPDRWAAVLGAAALFTHGDVLVCSFGTATTIDLLSRERDATFVGGLILPGIDTMRRSLAHDTARLPMAEGAIRPFGTTTEDAIASGVATAQAGSVQLAWQRAQARITGSSRTLHGIATGGGAELMRAMLDEAGMPFTTVPHLVLRGLHAIAEARRNDYDTHPEPHAATR